MIGGKVARIIRLGPEGMGWDEEDQKFQFPNTIKLVVEDYKGDIRPAHPDRCAVHVAMTNYEIEIGDTVWWQGDSVYWTKPGSRRHDVKLQKVGFTYSGESLDLPAKDNPE